MKIFVHFFIVLFASGAIIPAARASFGILPMEVHQQMPVGESRLTNEIEVYNGGDTPLHIASSIQDWKLTADGEYEYSEGGTEPLSCAKWIQVSPAEFNVGPKKTVRVRYTITAPEKFNTERRAMIFFTSHPIPTKNSQGISMLLSMRMGCKVFIAPAGTLTKTGKITDMNLINAPKPRVKVCVQNVDATTFRAKGTLQVCDEDGKVVAQGELNSAQVLPGATRNMWFTLDTPLPAGTYTLKAVIDHGVKQLLGGELRVNVVDEPSAPSAPKTPETNLPVTLVELPTTAPANSSITR